MLPSTESAVIAPQEKIGSSSIAYHGSVDLGTGAPRPSADSDRAGGEASSSADARADAAVGSSSSASTLRVARRPRSSRAAVRRLGFARRIRPG